ncbi:MULTISPECIES: SHOCT domain-containing protein [unclassified Leifsonia]|uniref:SHOCT domain-containing protein n=1 Tax=unclassified Leifsonia TaxID=2663824 RepID=UPI0008A75FB2|nr:MULTISPECIES: SHOCT domain-containing protein [unclassified Leifsonia]SEI12049.1 Short C-terminal domain-containing protein [Leifsonia sp. CL154]SFL94294.1 Short C-terminal domain-containing protein [Leifsonia sp. CL147]
MSPFRRGGRPGLIGMAAGTAVVAGTATAVSGNVQRRQNEHAQADAQQQAAAQQQAEQAAAAQQAAAQQQAQQAAAPAPPAASPGNDLTSQLQQLATLHAQGVLTEAEFTAAKTRLLA